MSSMFGVCISKLGSTRGLNRLYKISKNHNVMQVAFLTRAAHLEPRKKPAPFPYWKKEYTIWQQMVDPMIYRFDENTRLVIVDGPPAIGKTKLCERIANEFGLLYMPSPRDDDFYITAKGWDKRELDSQLPLLYKSFTLENFLENPNDIRTAKFQIIYFLMRMEQYLVALIHLLSTGQGVVLNRCVLSDIAFTEAMSKVGYISSDVLKYYMLMRTVPCEFPRPHLIIYLDAPVDVVQEKIKQRGKPEEIKSKVLNSEFLTNLEKAYKNKYLKELSNHSHLLVYDWSKEADFSYLVDDIENINFNDYSNDKLCDWEFLSESDVRDLRLSACDISNHLSEAYKRSSHIIPDELFSSSENLEIVDDIVSACPQLQLKKFSGESHIKIMLSTDSYDLFEFRESSRDLINLFKSKSV